MLCLFMSGWLLAAPLPVMAQDQTPAQNQPVATDALIDYVMALDERSLRLIQSRLLDLGYYQGRPHGVADEATFAAILAFHQSSPGPVEKLREQIREAASGHGGQTLDEEGHIHLRHGEDAQQKPLCLDLPGRTDCGEGGA